MKRKWLVGGLIVSLVLNIGLVGFLAGAASRPALFPRSYLDPAIGLPQLLRFLPPERREAVLQSAGDRELRRHVGGAVRHMRRAQAALHKALAAEPFDADALARALADFRDHFAKSQSRSHRAFVGVAARLTPEERRRFVASIKAKRRGEARSPKRRGRQSAYSEPASPR